MVLVLSSQGAMMLAWACARWLYKVAELGSVSVSGGSKDVDTAVSGVNSDGMCEQNLAVGSR